MTQVHGHNIVACIWDFDKTLIPGYMQKPLFDYYNVDADLFWKEVNSLPDLYGRRGVRVAADTVYLNHLLSYVKNGPMRGLTNQKLKELGAELHFYPGLPDFFGELAGLVNEKEFEDHDFKLEHYVISTGISQMIQGSQIFPYTEEVYACEFLESPFPPNFMSQTELSLPLDLEISQVGMTVDNTIKTRFIFEINKGSNKNSSIDVNSSMPHELRRIPINQMIYVADGPSDVPVFAVIKQMGGLAYAVYDPNCEREFEQSCHLVERGRVHNNGPANYTSKSPTSIWMKQKIRDMLRRMIRDRSERLNKKSAPSPRHINSTEIDSDESSLHQETFWK